MWLQVFNGPLRTPSSTLPHNQTGLWHGWGYKAWCQKFCHFALDYSCEANKDIEIVVQPLHLECHYNETFQLECIAMSRSGRPINYKWIRKKPGNKQYLFITVANLFCYTYIGRPVTLHSEERVEKSVLKYSWPKHDVLTIYCVVSTDGFATKVVSDEAEVIVHSSKRQFYCLPSMSCTWHCVCTYFMLTSNLSNGSNVVIFAKYCFVSLKNYMHVYYYSKYTYHCVHV